MHVERMPGNGIALLALFLFIHTVALGDDVRPEPSPVMKIASKVLDENVPDTERVKLIRSKPEYAADLLQTLVEDIEPGTPEESARIPWLWEITVFAAEKNNKDTIARILDIAIPGSKSKLANWQVAVIGGGLIFQLSKNGEDPRQTIDEMVRRDPLLQKRWEHLVKLSRFLVLDKNQTLGIRYDALRIFAMSDWDEAKVVYEKLFSSKEVKSQPEKELRLAAVTAVGDFKQKETTEFFVNRFSLLSVAEREKVCQVVCRDENAATRLLRSLKTGVISTKMLNRRSVQCFRSHASQRVRNLAATLFN